MSRYKLKNKGVGVDRIHTHAYESVDDITARDAIDVTNDRVAVGKVIYIKDIGDGTSAMQEWNGSAWVAHVFDEIVVGNDSIIKTEDGNGEIEIISTGDDARVGIKGLELSVGTPDNPKESIFGEGDSYPIPLAFHCTIANTNDLTITSAVNVTDILASDSGSTVGLFGDVVSGSYILVGSPYTFGGAKSKVSIAGNVEADNIVAEYLFNNNPTWVEVPFMSTLSNFPYTTFADDFSGIDNTSFQYRFGFDPNNLPVPWNPVTLNINGVDYENYYWGRFRITSNITSQPIIEQLKLHTNRYEVNADGRTEYFGRARYSRDLVMHWELTVQQQGFSPSNENIDFADNLQLVYQDNEFSASSIDGRGGYIVMPSGLDTSIPIQLEVLWIPEGSGSGDVKYRLITQPKRVGDIMDTSETGLEQEGIVSLDNQLHELQRTKLNVDVSKLKDGELLGFCVQRRGSDPDDTFGSTVSIVNIRAIGYFWTP